MGKVREKRKTMWKFRFKGNGTDAVVAFEVGFESHRNDANAFPGKSNDFIEKTSGLKFNCGFLEEKELFLFFSPFFSFSTEIADSKLFSVYSSKATHELCRDEESRLSKKCRTSIRSLFLLEISSHSFSARRTSLVIFFFPSIVFSDFRIKPR